MNISTPRPRSMRHPGALRHWGYRDAWRWVSRLRLGKYPGTFGMVHPRVSAELPPGYSSSNSMSFICLVEAPGVDGTGATAPDCAAVLDGVWILFSGVELRAAPIVVPTDWGCASAWRNCRNACSCKSPETGAGARVYRRLHRRGCSSHGRFTWRGCRARRSPAVAFAPPESPLGHAGLRGRPYGWLRALYLLRRGERLPQLLQRLTLQFPRNGRSRHRRGRDRFRRP